MMKNRHSDKDNNICLILPHISRYSQFLRFFLRKLNSKVFYRDDFNKDLLGPPPSDLFFIASDAYGKFLHVCVKKDTVDRISRIFSLNPDLLAKTGKETLYKSTGSDFLYSFQVTKGKLGKKAQIIYPASKRNRALFNSYLGAEPASAIVDILSEIGYLIEKIKLTAILFAKISYVGFLFFYWRLSKPSKLAKKVRENFIWIPSNLVEISLNPRKMSLPYYLRQLFEFVQFKNTKFAVICSSLNKEKYWDDGISFAIPSLRKLRPGLSSNLFFQGIKDLLKICVHIPIFFLKDSIDLYLLSLLPEMILGKTCLRNLAVKAVFLTDSCVGSAYPLIYAARETNIPTIMVCYSQSYRAVVLDAKYQDIVPAISQNILAEYFCVWTEMIKKWLIDAGYPKEKIFVAGPQMFAPVRLKKQLDKDNKVKIGLFTPPLISKEFCVKAGYGTTIFNSDYFMVFHKQALDVMKKVFGSNFVVLLKAKRTVTIDNKVFVYDLERMIKDVFLEFDVCVDNRKPDSNPWMVLDDADIIVSMPFTSLSEAGFAMEKPASFFDPSGLIAPRLQDEVPLLSGKEELYKWLSNIKNQEIYSKMTGRENYGPQKIAAVLKEIKEMKDYL